MLINVESNYVEFNGRIEFLPQSTIRNMLENIDFYQNNEIHCHVRKVDTDNLKLKIFIPRTDNVNWCCGNVKFFEYEREEAGTLFNVKAVISFEDRSDFNKFIRGNC